MKSQGIYCPAKNQESVEKIADADSDESLKRAVGAAFVSGECISSGIEVPVLVDKVSRERTSRGSHYYCYVRRGDHERLCSAAPSIATVTQLQGERTGDFTVIADNEKVLVAKCAEGGRVVVEKGKQWRRRSAVFLGVEEPVEREVPPDKERAVRDGCKGFDF
ncbi:hypothetical protein [Massilia sp. CF038]|uniref:hypothetical protein n=1 Tax=Massilia sp. CF038 TaxID=1881045 RepID=UPI0011611AA0|nr:hypothetical protein [Massilia sp. CF038]